MSIIKPRDPEAEARRIRATGEARADVRAVQLEQARAERRAREDDARHRRIVRRQARAERARAVQAWTASMAPRAVLIVPLVLVNALALSGQVGFAERYLHWPLMGAVVFGGTLESIAIYIGWHAHRALLAGDTASKLRAASYGMGFLVGGLNYQHYVHAWASPNVPAVTFGLMSVISPWLWAMHGRHVNRERLRSLGLVDERAPHFSAARWLHFPVATMGALRWGIREGVQDPGAAWDGHRMSRDGRQASQRRTVAPLSVITVRPVATLTHSITGPGSPASQTDAITSEGLSNLTQADAIRYALSVTGSADPGEVVSWLAEHGRSVDRRRVCDVINRDKRSAKPELSSSPLALRRVPSHPDSQEETPPSHPDSRRVAI